MTRYLLLTDLFFLLWYGLARKDLAKPWLFDRCREVQLNPNGHLDLWAREHYKSTIITFGLTIFDILNNPELTIGIFSHTRPIAKGFLRQIKREFEGNDLLKDTFPEILWSEPTKEASLSGGKWSEDDGIIVKRKSNPKESTVEAWGVVDGQPTSKHFDILIYDDIVVRESVNTPDMITKTTDSLALSYNLGAMGGLRRFIGTRYHFNDTYKEIIKRGTAQVRLYPATENGAVDGEPVLMTRELLAEKRRDMGPYIFSAQMMQNPTADSSQGFKREWLRHYTGLPDIVGGSTNKIILVDPAGEKRPNNDYTTMWVIGLGADQNFYWLDCIRDRLNLPERGRLLMQLHRKWKPLQVRYERYGMMGDIQHIQDLQDRENYRFTITEVAGIVHKNDRIKRLIPIFEQGRFYMPERMHYTNYEHVTLDLVSTFVEEEYCAFPVPSHDDMLDALARIAEPELTLTWPKERKVHVKNNVSYVGSGSWMR